MNNLIKMGVDEFMFVISCFVGKIIEDWKLLREKTG